MNRRGFLSSILALGVAPAYHARMKIDTAVNATLATITLLTAGIIFWPITAGLFIAASIMAPLDEARWWHSPVTFCLTFICAASLCLATDYPSFG